MNKGFILGISALYHDSAAALIQSGRIISAAQEERFSRIKHDASFPAQAISFCLQQAGLKLEQLDAVVFYDKPFLSFDRLLETHLSFAPRGARSFIRNMPLWVKEKLNLKAQLRKELCKLGQLKRQQLPPLLFTEHHQSHAASAFYPSPFKEAAVLCLDGVGEWATTTAWKGSNTQLEPLWQINFPHSLGLLYSAFTYYCGFKVNSGEYKLMGLAPYGQPSYSQLIKDHLINIKADGSFHLDLKYFNYCTGNTMTSKPFESLFDGPPRNPEADITQKELDLAASIQHVTEDILLKLAKTLRDETGLNKLCLAGGVALNCTANGKLAQSGLFEDIWIQPAAGDAGGAVGSALSASHFYQQHPRTTLDMTNDDGMQGCYLGIQYSHNEIIDWLEHNKLNYQTFTDDTLFNHCAELIDKGLILGWFQGAMEFGPRALGNRSIIGDPRNSEMQSKLNQKIKFRESFRPFAPAVLAEDAEQYFQHRSASPYMLFTAPVNPSVRNINSEQLMAGQKGLEKLYTPRSSIPAVTHIDYSARLQTVNGQHNPRFHQLLSAFKQLTNCPVLINTSFNVRGEPIVCSLDDAYQCFMETDMDYLVLENFILCKNSQPKYTIKKREFTPD